MLPYTGGAFLSEGAKSKWSAWRKAVLIHLGIVGLSLLLSVQIAPSIVPFDPKGMFAVFAVFTVLAGHAVAALVSLFIPKTSILSCGIVFFIAFFFTGCIGGYAIRDWAYLRYQAANDRFRDNLTSPIPKSVANLRLVSLWEMIRPDLMFQFDIDPADMDAILKKLKLERVDPNKMLNPKDFFAHAYYMPIEGNYHLFQGMDKFNEVLTIKTNESHSHAIFRKESSDFYRDQRWETGNPTIIQMDAESLEGMRKEYESIHGRGASKE
jgi:hypothetical protein